MRRRIQLLLGSFAIFTFYSGIGSSESFQYAAKFLCITNIPGSSQAPGSVLSGAYTTVVNINNPTDKMVGFHKNLVAASIGPSTFIGAELKPDDAGQVDCNNILRDFGFTFIHGFEGLLVIDSTHSLDLVAVYTARQEMARLLVLLWNEGY